MPERPNAIGKSYLSFFAIDRVIISSSSMMSSSRFRPAARIAPSGSRRNKAAFLDDLLIHVFRSRSTWCSWSRRRSGLAAGGLRRRKSNTSSSMMVNTTRTHAEIVPLAVYYLNNFEEFPDFFPHKTATTFRRNKACAADPAGYPGFFLNLCAGWNGSARCVEPVFADCFRV